MNNTNTAKFKVTQRCIVNKTVGLNAADRKRNGIMPTPAEVIHAYDGYQGEQMYRVRELATGVEYPVMEADLRAYLPKPKLKLISRGFRPTAMCLMV